jgi:hypothetical protein
MNDQQSSSQNDPTTAANKNSVNDYIKLESSGGARERAMT